MSEEPPNPPSNVHWRTYVGRAWKRQCPRCGEGVLFASRFRLAERCETCGLVFRREDGAMTGQMYLSAAVTEIVAGLFVLAIFFGTDLGPIPSIAIGLPLIVAFSYWFLPKAMGLWVAIEFMTDVGNREPWVRD